MKNLDTTREHRPMLYCVFHSVLALFASIVLFACGDPGSGGSGLPTGDSPSVPSGSSGLPPSGAPLTGGSADSRLSIERIESDALVIAGVRYLLADIEIVNQQGLSIALTSLRVGQSVEIFVLSQDAPRRWRLTVLPFAP